MTRDILNYQGTVIGQLELPDDTSEQVWTEKLSVYALPPAAQTIPDVTPRQIRQALVLGGISLATIDAALNSLPEPQKSLALISWNYSLAFERNQELVESVAHLLGWTSQQLDDLWLFAGTL